MHIIDFATAPGAVIEQFASVVPQAFILEMVLVSRMSMWCALPPIVRSGSTLRDLVSSFSWSRAQAGGCFARGELHAKGSDTGMTAIMIQMYDYR